MSEGGKAIEIEATMKITGGYTDFDPEVNYGIALIDGYTSI